MYDRLNCASFKSAIFPKTRSALLSQMTMVLPNTDHIVAYYNTKRMQQKNKKKQSLMKKQKLDICTQKVNYPSCITINSY